MYIYVLEVILYALSYVKGENKNKVMLGIDDQNTTHVFLHPKPPMLNN